MAKFEKSNVLKKIKRSFKKLKYLDKTQSSYFVVTTFIAAFCMFTGVTYSYFTFSKNLHAATITIAKLNYTLESSTEGYNNGTFVVPKGETKFLDLDLRSLNTAKTRYALNYKTSNKGVNVYYSETLRKNTSGIIGPEGSIINMRIVLENTSEEDATVNFTISGGYIQNNLTTNITTGYFEEDLTIRPILYDENFDNATLVTSFPEKDEYSFYKVECSNGVVGSFDVDNWTLKRSDTSKKTSCDVYFKKANSELELYYQVLGSNASSSISLIKPDTNGLYRYKSSSCTPGTEYTFDENTYEFKISSSKPNTVCVANFETDEEIASNDRFNVMFDNAGGKSNVTNKTVIANGTYGYLPIPYKERNIFLGWFTNEGEQVTSATPVNLTANIKLYAHWQEAEQVNVSLHSIKKDASMPSSLDDHGTTYYYPSDAVDNHIKFANLYWRILRVNGDGTLRIIYDGTRTHENGEVDLDRVVSEKTQFNTSSDDAKYVGYMYDGIPEENEEIVNKTSSTIKTTLETWYKNNIVNKKFANYVADSIFCNDTTTSELGYGAYERLSLPEARNPQITCTDKNNAYTVKDTTHGNATLDYPIGLITADEAVLANALASQDSYLYRGTPFWTMSPSKFEDTARMFIVSNAETENSVDNETALVPVINLNADYVARLEGDGTIDSPFKVR